MTSASHCARIGCDPGMGADWAASFSCCRVWVDISVSHHGQRVPPAGAVQGSYEFVHRGGSYDPSFNQPSDSI